MSAWPRRLLSRAIHRQTGSEASGTSCPAARTCIGIFEIVAGQHEKAHGVPKPMLAISAARHHFAWFPRLPLLGRRSPSTESLLRPGHRPKSSGEVASFFRATGSCDLLLPIRMLEGDGVDVAGSMRDAGHPARAACHCPGQGGGGSGKTCRPLDEAQGHFLAQDKVRRQDQHVWKVRLAWHAPWRNGVGVGVCVCVCSGEVTAAFLGLVQCAWARPTLRTAASGQSPGSYVLVCNQRINRTYLRQVSSLKHRIPVKRTAASSDPRQTGATNLAACLLGLLGQLETALGQVGRSSVEYFESLLLQGGRLLAGIHFGLCISWASSLGRFACDQSNFPFRLSHKLTDRYLLCFVSCQTRATRP